VFNGKVLLNSPVVVNDSGFNHVGTLPFVFPSLGNYQIYFSGTPTGSYVFHEFNLSFTKDVSQAGRSPYSDTPFFIGSAILGLAIMGVAFWAAKEFKDA